MKVTRLRELAVYIVSKTGPVSQLKLAKLIYLIEWSFYRERGVQLTKAYYMRERRGPVPATFGSDLAEMVGFELVVKRGLVSPGPRPRFEPRFTDSERSLIDAGLRRYGARSERDLLVATYLSEPMKVVLKEERTGASRRHEGFRFQRFASKVHGTRVQEIPTPEEFEFVGPHEMTDDDTVAVIEVCTTIFPLMATAQALPHDDQ